MDSLFDCLTAVTALVPLIREERYKRLLCPPTLLIYPHRPSRHLDLIPADRHNFLIPTPLFPITFIPIQQTPHTGQASIFQKFDLSNFNFWICKALSIPQDMAVGQTVTVVNKSGKVVSTSKHLVNVFKEAKSAYRERKAEIKAVRDAGEAEKQARKALKDLEVNDDNVSRTSSRRSNGSHRSHRSRGERPPIERRGVTDSFYVNDRRPRPSGLRNQVDINGEVQNNELVRRHSDGLSREHERPKTSRSASVNDIDMDLAYGELPPPLPERRYDTEVELRSKMSALQQLLDEVNCVQHSVIATIESLQKNPEALAAVALTLGEISNIAAKMAPGALMSMKSAFPAVIALLISPEFMIAAGVGVGITIIMFGGYKIIKKIQQRKEAKALDAAPEEETESASEFDELREIDSELSHIEQWRRGIADAEADSLGTSVEGEFVTPGASKFLVAEGVIREDDLKSTKSGRTSKSKKSRSKGKDSGSKDKAKKDRKKEPSGLRMLFKTR